MLRPEVSMEIAGTPPASAVDAGGTFVMKGVGPYDFRLVVTGMPPNAYVKMARYSSMDVMNEPLHLDRQPSGPLDILISTTASAAAGTVQNEKREPIVNAKPQAFARILPIPPRFRMDEIQSCGVCETAEGRFRPLKTCGWATLAIVLQQFAKDSDLHTFPSKILDALLLDYSNCHMG